MSSRDRDHLNLLCDIGDLAALLAGGENIDNFFQQTVEMVARHMNAHACSIYLLDEKSNELTLKATVGLNPAVMGKVRLKIGEGPVEATLEIPEPIKEGSAGRHPGFKMISSIKTRPKFCNT